MKTSILSIFCLLIISATSLNGQSSNDALVSLSSNSTSKPTSSIRLGILLDGINIDIRQGISLSGYQQGTFKITLAERAMTGGPIRKHVSYETNGAFITLARGGRALKSVLFYNAEGNIANTLADAQVGDRLIIQMKDMAYLDSDNQSVTKKDLQFVVKIIE